MQLGNRTYIILVKEFGSLTIMPMKIFLYLLSVFNLINNSNQSHFILEFSVFLLKLKLRVTNVFC